MRLVFISVEEMLKLYASMGDYRRATCFEAVMGYLYLTEQSERMMELIKKGLNNIKENKE